MSIAPYTDLHHQYLAGQWRDGSADRVEDDVAPWDGRTLLALRLAGNDDVNLAFDAAVETQRSWAAEPPGERRAVLLRAADIIDARREEMIGWLVEEAGATVQRADAEWRYCGAILRESASMPHHVEGRIMPSDVPGKTSFVFRRPIGVIVVISPWNYPLWLSLRSVGPALAVGNAVVLKPASDTPVTGGTLIGRVFEEAGLPPGVLQVLVGAGSDIGDTIVSHPDAGAISFTGSTAVGIRIPAKAGVKRLGLELGGNAPLVVLDDADLDNAVEAAVFGSYFHQGQICVRANRIVVERSIADDFVERFVSAARALPVGDPRDASTRIGPIINAAQLSGIQDRVQRAVAAGAELLVGGEPEGPSGLTLPPHVLRGTNAVATAAEEVFGPVATIITVDDEHEALAVANDTRYGLSSAVFSKDVWRAVSFARRMRAGMTHVNDSPINDDPNTAFGGEKDSGLGRFGGLWAVEEFTTDHWVSVQEQPRAYGF